PVPPPPPLLPYTTLFRSYWIMVYFCLFMTGFGLTLMPLVTVSMSELGDKDIPHGSAIVNTVRQFAMAFGIIILTSIISITVALRSEEHTSELQSRFDIVC